MALSLSAPHHRTLSPPDWFYLVCLSILWGGSFFLTSIAVREIPPMTLAALRVAGAALILMLVLRLSGQALPTGRKIILAFFGMGLLNNAVPFCLIMWSQTQLAGGLAAILNATTPLWTVLIAHTATRDERATRLKLAGVTIGLFGVAVMVGIDALSNLGGDLLPQIAILGAAVSYACAGIFGRRFKRMDVTPLATAAGQVTASTLLLEQIQFKPGRSHKL